MRPVRITYTPSNASANSIALSQQPLGSGPITLTATAANIDKGLAHYLLITTTATETTTITITGLDADGNTTTENVALPNTTTQLSFYAYSSVSSIIINGAAVGPFTIGTSNLTKCVITPVIPLEFYSRTGATAAISVTGTINFTIRETFDPILSSGTANAVWINPSALASKTSNTVASLDVGATGCDVLINSYTNSATLTIRIISVESDKG